MKTKELIRRLFETDALQGAQRREAVEELAQKLAKKRAKLEQKLAEEGSDEGRRKLQQKLEVNAVHQQKAAALLAELSEG